MDSDNLEKDNGIPTGDPIIEETLAKSVLETVHNFPETDNDDDMPEGKVIDLNELEADELLLPGESRILEEDDFSKSEMSGADETLESIDASELQVRRVAAAENSKNADAEPKGFLFSLLDTIRFVCLGLLIGILLVVFVIQRNDVFGTSMEPTLHNQDAVFVEMISVYLKSFERGDIITIEAEGMDGYDGTEKIIKRIVGMPGETISFVDGYVFINGVILNEPYLSPGLLTYVSLDGVTKGYDEITLGPDEYFCLGDNRGASNDSRRLGPIPVSRIKSHVIAKIYPFDQMTFYNF
jgi:signal peptidase I